MTIITVKGFMHIECRKQHCDSGILVTMIEIWLQLFDYHALKFYKLVFQNKLCKISVAFTRLHHHHLSDKYTSFTDNLFFLHRYIQGAHFGGDDKIISNEVGKLGGTFELAMDSGNQPPSAGPTLRARLIGQGYKQVIHKPLNLIDEYAVLHLAFLPSTVFPSKCLDM